MNQNQFGHTKNQFVVTQNHFLVTHPKTLSIPMGYSKKRRRGQRLRDRKKSQIPKIGLPDEDSSLSESSSFQFIPMDEEVDSNDDNTYGNSNDFNHQPDTNQIPKSIFLDDIEYMVPTNQNDRTTDTEDIANETTEMMEVEETDLFLNYREEMSNIDSYSCNDTNDMSTHPSFSPMDPKYGYNDNDPFDRMTCNDIASYRIMSMLDSVGAPRYCYDKLITLLKKLTKKDSFDIQKAVSRDTLMRKLAACKNCPRIENQTICNQEVFRFSFVDMLQDLLNGCNKQLHMISSYGENVLVHDSQHHELWNTQWMRNTFQKEQFSDFDTEKDVMLPLILYMDKTGTDVNQRYSLEPVLFSLAAIAREHRESRFSWRHLGFIPQRKSISPEDEMDTSLQIYHDFLRYLLDGIMDAQHHPPLVYVKLAGGEIVPRRARLPLMIVMGDQLSQDTLCGRIKSNSGGAGRVHRSCMCSYLHVDNPYHECKKVDMVPVNFWISESLKSDEMISEQLNKISSLSECTQQQKNITKAYLLKKRNMFRSILRHPFTLHSLKNAFDDIDFGSWKGGIHDATFDDFMHSVESGMISYITETVYGGLTRKEKEAIEEYTRNIFLHHRCSTISEFPRMRLQQGFTRQTLLTSGERVGSLLALSLSLQDVRVREIIRSGHARQIEKYLDISIQETAEDTVQSNMKESDEKLVPENKVRDIYLRQHMHTLDDVSVKKTMEHMIRHGCNLDFADDLDVFQLNHMIFYASEIFKNTEYPKHYPPCTIPEDNTYINIGNDIKHNKSREDKIIHALKAKSPEQMLRLLGGRRVVGVIGCTKKHYLKKNNKRGEGSSAAILTSNMATVNIFFEYVLCYHAFCKYSWSLPIFLQTFHENIRNGNRFVVEYFQKLLYRGNSTIDSRFPKIHSQTRMADNIIQLNSVMNFCCETGERLLKTEAKGISRTAQQRGDDTFLKQTMSRLQERCILDSFSIYLEKYDVEDNFVQESRHGQDCSGRICPNFHFDVETDTLTTLDRFGKKRFPDKDSGFVEQSILKELKKKDPNAKEFHIFNEVILRNNNHVRATPNYSKSGPWYDYVNISWEYDGDDGTIKTFLLPAKCLCFFRSINITKDQQEERDSELLALIHSADGTTEGKVPGRVDTLLTKNFKLEFDKSKLPKTDVVSVATIDNPICCYPHTLCNEILGPNSPPITYLLPRNHWSYMWMAMNQCIQESNSPNVMRSRKGLNPLCDQKWLTRVRKTCEKYMRAKSMIDLTHT